MSASNAITALRQKIDDRSAVLGFIGLGYVGLPVSLALAQSGFRVRAYDIDKARVTAVESGNLPFATAEPGLLELLRGVRSRASFSASSDESILAGCDVFFVAIDTPITPARQLDHQRLLDGIAPAARQLRRGCMLVIESTIAPGTIDRIVLPALARQAPYVLGRDYFVLHCPERLRPGRLLRNLRELDRIVGGDSEASANVGIILYRNIVRAGLRASHYRTAEVIKTAENAARDIQIALANQIALVSDAAGVNFTDVRAAVNELWANEPLVLEAGPGVGGHCLPKDPWLFVAELEEGPQRGLVHGARSVNSYMPEYTVRLARRALQGAGRPVSGSSVVLLGVSYNADTDDMRNSPALEIRRLLEIDEAIVRLHDPYVPEYAEDMWTALEGADLAILVNAHREYLEIDPVRLRSIMSTPVLVDTRRVLDPRTFGAAGVRYSALGAGEARRYPD